MLTSRLVSVVFQCSLSFLQCNVLKLGKIFTETLQLSKQEWFARFNQFQMTQESPRSQKSWIWRVQTVVRSLRKKLGSQWSRAMIFWLRNWTHQVAAKFVSAWWPNSRRSCSSSASLLPTLDPLWLTFSSSALQDKYIFLKRMKNNEVKAWGFSCKFQRASIRHAFKSAQQLVYMFPPQFSWNRTGFEYIRLHSCTPPRCTWDTSCRPGYATPTASMNIYRRGTFPSINSEHVCTIKVESRLRERKTANNGLWRLQAGQTCRAAAYRSWPTLRDCASRRTDADGLQTHIQSPLGERRILSKCAFSADATLIIND